MKLFLILFILGISFVIIGYSNQFTKNIDDVEKTTIQVEYIPRKVYDDLVLSSPLST